MRGRILNIDYANKQGKVETRNDDYGVLTVYFKDIPEGINENSTIEFDLKVSAKGNKYAKFLSLVDRNQALFNTEDRNQWYEWGENEELDFVNKVAPKIGVDLILNPAKDNVPWEIDLFDKTNNRYADLKTQNTPFFTCLKYTYAGKKYDPTYTVTFNKKDYENYRVSHPDCDIYFWVNWIQLKYKNIVVEPVHGVWVARFEKMKEAIENRKVQLHSYQNRQNDDHNARESYLFYLKDEDIFRKCL